MSEASGTMACPTCGKVAERMISAGGGLLFKGSGFYITDYGKDGKKDQRAKAASDATKSDSAKESSGGTSKDAAGKSAAEPKSDGGGSTKPAKPADAKPAGPAPSSSSGSSDA